MAYQDYRSMKITLSKRVAWVTIDHPPINLFDMTLITEMDQLSQELATDDDVRAVVFQSANPEFFIAHADVDLIRNLPTDVTERPTELNMFHRMAERFRTMPKATIGKIAGIARGGGSEFLLALDMRFAAIGPTCLSQPEVAIGIFPTGGGTQRLPPLLGRARALEIMLGCGDFDAELAERYGYINRALPADELDGFVETLANRIASYPANSIALTKHNVDAGARSPLEGLLEEIHGFNQVRTTSEGQNLMAQFMDRGGQTREAELNMASLLESLDRS